MTELEVIAGLMARGVPLHVAQGMAANMIAESGLNPGVNEKNPLVPGSRGGFGLNQWTGPRRTQFEAFANDRGADPADPNTQLDFTMWELRNSEKKAGDKLFSAPDAVTAAEIYSNDFLRPGIPHMDRRIAEARRLAGMGGNDLAKAADAPKPETNADRVNQIQTLQQRFAYNNFQLDPQAFMRAIPNNLRGV